MMGVIVSFKFLPVRSYRSGRCRSGIPSLSDVQDFGVRLPVRSEPPYIKVSRTGSYPVSTGVSAEVQSETRALRRVTQQAYKT